MDRSIPAFLQTWYAGEEGGTALAQILTGAADPSGRLPISWERSLKDNPSYPYYYPTSDDSKSEKVYYKDDIFVGYRGYEKANTKPLFPFGYGLSYTTFKYANLKVAPAPEPANSPVTKGAGTLYEVSFDVTNSGQRAGADVAQLYVSEENPKIDRPKQELKGFSRVALEPGETRHVQIPLNARSFTWYDDKTKAWHADAGSFDVHISRSSIDPPTGRQNYPGPTNYYPCRITTPRPILRETRRV